MTKLLAIALLALLASFTDIRAIDQLLYQRIKKVDYELAHGRITPYQYSDRLMDEYENAMPGARERMRQNEIKQHRLYLEIMEPIVRRSA